MSKNDGLRVMVGFWNVLSLSFVLCALLVAQQVGAQAADAASVPLQTPAPDTASARSQMMLPAPATVLAPPTWLVLSPIQQTALMPLERDWDSLDTSSRSKWLSIATRFATLPAEEQARMHERMRAWARSTPAERQQARIGFQVAKQVAADQRQAKWEAYQALPPERRQELADKAAQKLAAKPPARRVVASEGPQSKSNLVPAALKGQAVKVLTPSILQAKPGVTTVLITQGKTPPAHQQAGQTKVFADPDLVDSKTLLPKRRLTTAGS